MTLVIYEDCMPSSWTQMLPRRMFRVSAGSNTIAPFARRAASSDLCKLPMILLPDLDLGARDSISG